MTTQALSAIAPVPCVNGKLAEEPWGEQQLYWSERMRGRGLRWPRDADWFVNDPLGHAAHLHPGASEIYFLASGRLELVVGSERLELREGDLCLIPTGAYHDPIGTLGTDLCLFCAVAPNWRGARWQTDSIPPDAFQARARVARVDRAGPLPSDGLLSCECVELAAGAVLEAAFERGSERVVYVLDGELEVTVEALRGRLGPHQYIHVPAYARHRVAATPAGPARVLSIIGTPTPERMTPFDPVSGP